MADNIIDSAVEFLEKVRSEPAVIIKFRKKDNSERIMQCTLDFNAIPSKYRPKSVDLPKILKLLKDKGIIHVFDIENKEWKSVNFETVEWLQTLDRKKFYRKK